MAGTAQACPGAETMALFLEGGLDDGGAQRVRGHVASCAECRSLLADAARDEEPAPEVLGDRYVLERQLARGGMGSVFLARDETRGTKVAIKLIRPELLDDPQVVRRFEREARAARVLESRHVVKVLDVDRLSTGEPFIVMEYLDGLDLGELVRHAGPLAIEDAVRYVIETCEAISEAHAKGIVHRDLKPQNLFLVKGSDREPFVKVLDFGLAKALAGGALDRSFVTVTRALLGSPRFMSPEQMRGDKDVDERTDVWSIGATLFYLVTGASAFEGSDIVSIRARVLAADASALRAHRPDAPPALEALVRRCLQADRQARPTVDELSRELRELAATFAPRPPADVVPDGRQQRRQKRRRGVIAVSFLAVASVAGVVMARSVVGANEETSEAAASAPLPVTTTDDPPIAPEPETPDEATPGSPQPPSPGRAPAVRAPRPGRRPAAGGKSCHPPYTVDSIGRRIYNRDCL